MVSIAGVIEALFGSGLVVIGSYVIYLFQQRREEKRREEEKIDRMIDDYSDIYRDYRSNVKEISNVGHTSPVDKHKTAARKFASSLGEPDLKTASMQELIRLHESGDSEPYLVYTVALGVLAEDIQSYDDADKILDGAYNLRRIIDEIDEYGGAPEWAHDFQEELGLFIKKNEKYADNFPMV